MAPQDGAIAPAAHSSSTGTAIARVRRTGTAFMVSRTPEAGVVRVTPADIPFYVCIWLAYSACGPDATFWNRTPRIKDTRKPDSEFTMLNSVIDPDFR
jgi:hypothetical protein